MLKKNFKLLQGRFYENHMVLNLGKCHYVIINKDIAKESIELGKKTLHAEAVKFTKTANQKLSPLVRVEPLMTNFNKKVIFNSFIKGQFTTI